MSFCGGNGKDCGHQECYPLTFGNSDKKRSKHTRKKAPRKKRPSKRKGV